METTVSERGQTAIPAQIRRKYHLVPHTKLTWLETREGLTIVPISKNPIESLRGRFQGKGLMKALLDERKKERQRERYEDERWIQRHLRP